MHPVAKRCPTCGNAKIRLVRSDYKTRIKGRDVLVPKLERQECSRCGEVLFDSEAMARLEAFWTKKRKLSSLAR